MRYLVQYIVIVGINFFKHALNVQFSRCEITLVLFFLYKESSACWVRMVLVFPTVRIGIWFQPIHFPYDLVLCTNADIRVRLRSIVLNGTTLVIKCSTVHVPLIERV
jgi:hypothetical protein